MRKILSIVLLLAVCLLPAALADGNWGDVSVFSAPFSVDFAALQGGIELSMTSNNMTASFSPETGVSGGRYETTVAGNDNMYPVSILTDGAGSVYAMCSSFSIPASSEMTTEGDKLGTSTGVMVFSLVIAEKGMTQEVIDTINSVQAEFTEGLAPLEHLDQYSDEEFYNGLTFTSTVYGNVMTVYIKADRSSNDLFFEIVYAPEAAVLG